MTKNATMWAAVIIVCAGVLWYAYASSNDSMMMKQEKTDAMMTDTPDKTGDAMKNGDTDTMMKGSDAMMNDATGTTMKNDSMKADASMQTGDTMMKGDSMQKVQ